MNAYRLKPLSFPWPPLLYGIAICSAFLVERVAFLPVAHITGNLAGIIGVLLMALGIFLDVWAMATLFAAKTTMLPCRCSTYLVTRGPFRYSRNPTYLGYTLMTAGIGLLSGNPWFLLTAVLAAIGTTMIAIRCEEMHLLARFGIEFERYCQRTRRWI